MSSHEREAGGRGAVSRRSFLVAGGAAIGGAGLSDWARPAEAAVETAARSARSGFEFVGARMLWITVPVDASVAAALLPPSLRMASPATASVFVAHYPRTDFGSVYNEATILLHVVAADGPAWHCPWIVVDDDTALILGREMTGFPKKLGAISLREGHGLIRGVARRKGTELVRLEGRTSSFRSAPGRIWKRRLLNVNGTFPSGMRLQQIGPLSERVHARLAGRATLTLGSSPHDDLRSLVPRPTAGPALFAVADFGLFTDGRPPSGAPLPASAAFARQLRTAE